MTIKYDYNDIYEGGCTREQYYAQFNPIKLEIGKTYEVAGSAGKWDAATFLITHIENGVAMAKEQSGTGHNVHGPKYIAYSLFYAETGFKYNDNRMYYRLQEIKC